MPWVPSSAVIGLVNLREDSWGGRYALAGMGSGRPALARLDTSAGPWRTTPVSHTRRVIGGEHAVRVTSLGTSERMAPGRSRAQPCRQR